MSHRSSTQLRRIMHGLAVALVVLSAPASRSDNSRDFQSALHLALDPGLPTVQYNYVMTGKVRLLVLWFGADDVGGGYIRRGASLTDPSVDFIQVLFGSDPAKAPRRINHWGSAIETSGHSSALFGFMKTAKTASPEAAETEILKQKQKGEHAFEAIVSVVDNNRAISRVVPMLSEVDFNFHQLAEAQELAVERLSQDGPVRQLNSPTRKCAASRGFLHAVDELAQGALRTKEAGQSLCYVHNARDYTLTLRKRSLVKSKEIEFKLKSGKKVKKTYTNLVLAQFAAFNRQSGEQTEFELLLDGSEEMAGVPIQISYQPNFWFKVVLNLDTVTQGDVDHE
jgi:hypothetical protein